MPQKNQNAANQLAVLHPTFLSWAAYLTLLANVFVLSHDIK